MMLPRLLFLIASLLAAVLANKDHIHAKRAINPSAFVSKHSEIVEGSGFPGSVSGHPDLEVHGSGSPAPGYSSDDEDAEVQGSGAPPGDVVEGSGGGMPAVIYRPQMTTSTTTQATPHWKPDTSITHGVLHPIQRLPEDDLREKEDEEMSVVVQEEVRTTTSTTTTTYRPPVGTTPPRNGDTATQGPFHHMLKPGIFAAVVGGTVVGLLTAVLLVMFIIHRMRKKDEGSYALDEPKPRPYAGYTYTKASTKEFYA